MSLARLQKLVSIAAMLAFCACVGVAELEAVEGTTGEALKLAGLYLKLGQTDQCRAVLEPFLKSNPANVDGLVLLGRLELKQGHQDAALKAATAALAQAPDDIDAVIVKARSLSARGESVEAQKLLARVPPDELDKHEQELEGVLAAKALSIADIEKARTEKNDEALDDLMENARHALASHNVAKADKLTLQVLSEAPHNPDAIVLRADVLSQSGRADEAVALLQKLKAGRSTKGPFTEELAMASALQEAGRTDEARRAYQLVAGSSNYSDEDRDQARGALSSMNAQKALAEGDTAMDAGQAEKALALAEAALKSDPKNEEAKMLKARALAASGKAHDAVEMLRLLKSASPGGKRFEGQADYAGALAADHHYREALAAYQEIEDTPALYKAEERTSAREQMTDLRENDLAGGSVEVTGGSFEEGRLWRAISRFESSRFGSLRYSVDTEWDHVNLSRRMFHRAVEEDRFSSSVGLSTAWTSRFSSDFHVGGFESGVMAGAGLTYHPAGRTTLSLHADYNDPAHDTLQLMALDGRQHALTANFSVPLGKHVVVESMLQARQIEVNGTNAGHSVGTETQVRWHPVSLDDGLYFAYMLELKDFSGREGAFEREAQAFFGDGSAHPHSVFAAVPEHINRHALQAHESAHLTSALKAEASAELAWREETAKLEYGLTAGLLWQVSSSTTVNARLEYYSGGSGPNAGAGVLLGTVGAKWIW